MKLAELICRAVKKCENSNETICTILCRCYQVCETGCAVDRHFEKAKCREQNCFVHEIIELAEGKTNV